MDRLLVTGATGFVGRWTLRHWRLSHPDTQVWATSNQPDCPRELADEFRVLDLRDGEAVRDLVRVCHPTQVIHLGGLVGQAPLAEHLAVNVLGTENLYSALADLEQSVEMRAVQAGTAAIYGRVRVDELPVSERNPPRPLTAYAVSKAMQDFLAEAFWRTRGLNIIRTRIFNLLGPGQPERLVPATFIRQLKQRRDGEPLKVGNLRARRDFVDVRDVARAFDQLLYKGRPEEAYNIASGTSVAVRDVLKALLEVSGLVHVTIEEESTRMRDNDVPDVYGDTTAIIADTGWRPRISLRESLMAMWSS